MKPTSHAFKSTFKATLIALSIAAISPAHATGVPTVDGSAIISNLQQWYQSAQRWYSQISSMKPGELAESLLGLDKANAQADKDIKRLEAIKKQMQESNPCNRYEQQATHPMCLQEAALKVERIDAYIVMMKDLKDDYNDLANAVRTRNAKAGSFNVGDMLTGGGDTKEGEINTSDQAIIDARAKIAQTMEQHKKSIDGITDNINMVHGIRVDVARIQFEGSSGNAGLSEVIGQAAVSTVLEGATRRYRNDAEDIREGTNESEDSTRVGTNY